MKGIKCFFIVLIGILIATPAFASECSNRVDDVRLKEEALGQVRAVFNSNSQQPAEGSADSLDNN